MTRISTSLLLLALALTLSISEAQAGANYNQRQYGATPGGKPPTVHFTKTIDDLPLMPGLEQEDDKDVLFIFGPRRIAQTSASGKVDIDNVYYFYQDSLPQLGWQRITPRLYEREGERLHIDASSANAEGLTIVHFAVEPIGGK